jgi:hypothetical protein
MQDRCLNVIALSIRHDFDVREGMLRDLGVHVSGRRPAAFQGKGMVAFASFELSLFFLFPATALTT